MHEIKYLFKVLDHVVGYDYQNFVRVFKSNDPEIPSSTDVVKYDATDSALEVYHFVNGFYPEKFDKALELAAMPQ